MSTYRCTYTITALTTNTVVKTASIDVVAQNRKTAGIQATDKVADEDPYYDDRIQPMITILEIERVSKDE